MDIWPFVENLKGKTLFTLAYKKAFEIIEINNNEVNILVHSTNKERKILKKNIDNAAKYLFSNKTITRIYIRDNFSEANPAYIAAILASLPDVTHKNKPITLYYRHL